MKISNDELLKFYADKSTVGCEYTEEYMKNHNPTGSYAGVRNTFLRLRDGKSARGENANFYRWLKGKLENEGLKGLHTLSFLNGHNKEGERFYALLENGEESFTQKWHLYVSWAAFKEYWGKYDPDKNAPNFKCPELLLWMCEAAGTDRKTVEDLYVKIDKIAADIEDVKARLDSWTSEICEEIERRIAPA